MNQILDAISGAFGTFFDDPTIQLILRAIGFYIVFIWLATAYYAYRDMSHRTTNPIAPYLAAALIILFTPILFVFAFVLYRILRPQETVAEAQERALAEEAMLVEVERQAHCANCGRAVHTDWIICPSCRNRLRRFCPNCSNLVELDWSLCPWCGKDFERPEQLPERVRAGRQVRPGTVPAGSVSAAQLIAAASAAAPRATAPAAVTQPPAPAMVATASATLPAAVVQHESSPALAPSMAATTAALAAAAVPADTTPAETTPAATTPADIPPADPPVAQAAPPPPPPPSPAAAKPVPAPRPVRVRAARLKPAAADGPIPPNPGARSQ
ncbi:MAG TPA: zinc ribbon domain-containing protein [Candidatus Sulfotelmatobacter sp.]|nr:zinc ribbon domain-containing protein [Candidatus Sulfotelmatobacter sp.]